MINQFKTSMFDSLFGKETRDEKEENRAELINSFVRISFSGMIVNIYNFISSFIFFVE